MLEMKKGHIVTMASTASFIAAPGLVDYACSKVGALYLNDGV
jgi:short-subunit dehydrogenase